MSEAHSPTEHSDSPTTIRQEIDVVLARGLDIICDTISNITRKSVEAASSPHRGQVLASVAQIVGRIRESSDLHLAEAMLRYTFEGSENTYTDDPVPLLELLSQHGFLGAEDTALLDLGSGSGGMVRAWKETGRPALGIDLSPTFVLRDPDLRHGRIDAGFTDLVDAVGEHKPGLVLTSMTLDRVRHPSELLSNVVNLARMYGSPFVIVTILPILSVDDDKTDWPITYADARDKITTGTNPDEDEGELLSLLEKLAPDYDTQVHRNTSSIQSSGDTHTYIQYCFCGRPKKQA